MLKYQCLKDAIIQLGYKCCKLLVFIFGSLCNEGMPKPRAEALAKFGSVSVIIGSCHNGGGNASCSHDLYPEILVIEFPKFVQYIYYCVCSIISC